jgi:thioredoxin reductase
VDTDTTIVGAGPYGLSIAAHLRAAGVPFLIFGQPLESWQRFMPRHMVLKSERFASSLSDPRRRYTLRRYCEEQHLPYQAVGSPLPLQQFLAYAEWFRRQVPVEVRQTRVVHVARIRHGFSLLLADGSSLRTRRVVLAIGHMDFRRVPPELQRMPEPHIVHSSRLGAIEDYAGRDITIIGAGQSALETAALAHEAGARVRVLVRKARVAWNSPSRPRPLLQRMIAPDAALAPGWRAMAVSELPRLFRWCFAPEKRHRFVAGAYGPSGAWWLRDRVDGQVEILLGSRAQSVRPASGRIAVTVQGPDGTREIVTDRLVAATGFQVDIDRLAYLDASLRMGIVREAGGIPALDAAFETSVPGLFIVGLASAPVFGPVMRFVYGARHTAPLLARRIRSAVARLGALQQRRVRRSRRSRPAPNA